MSCPQEYVAHLRSALAHLHDPAYLEKHPLAGRIDFVAQAPDLSRGQLLRRTLRLSIEALDPGPGVAPNAPEARPYQLLLGRYILRQSLVQVAMQLDIGRRQAYRELHRALEALAQILWDSQQSAGQDSREPVNKLPSFAARVRNEVERLASESSEDIDVAQLLANAVEKAQLLAHKRELKIELYAESSNLRVATNRVMLRQVILNLLSHIVHVHQEGRCIVQLARGRDTAVMRFTYRAAEPLPDVFGAGQPYTVASQLLETLNVDWSREDNPDGTTRISVHIPLAKKHSVLVVDDNPGIVRLFGRYLDGRSYHLFSATTIAEALELMARIQPEVVILDVMMPRRDGWELLEAIRQNEANRKTRVLVCSIINDPDLATALGADAFLHKPVDQLSLLQALDSLLSSPM